MFDLTPEHLKVILQYGGLVIGALALWALIYLIHYLSKTAGSMKELEAGVKKLSCGIENLGVRIDRISDLVGWSIGVSRGPREEPGEDSLPRIPSEISNPTRQHSGSYRSENERTRQVAGSEVSEGAA